MTPRYGIFDWIEASSRPPAEVYEHKLELAAAAERAGFHAFLVAEHHGTPLSIDGSPTALLSAIFQRTRHLRAGALTFCLPWYHPYRFYSEVCMLDHLSYGRLELGVGRGVSPIESRIFGYNSIEESRERYRATLDTFFAACASPVMKVSGVEAELHLKPYQKPYPPLWFPSSNKESIEFTARHGYNTAFIGKHADCKPMFERYRELWEKHRNDAGRHNAHVAAPFLARPQHLVVAETDAEAEKLGLQAYEIWAGHIHHLTRKLGRPDVHKTTPHDEDSAQRLIAGSPQTALEKLEEMLRLTGANYLLCIFSFGDIAPDYAIRSLELFAEEVMPKLARSSR
ncbi:MAG TPA: LLM class flavin-dependent oxidoreductase [Burkholderiales bacterium]|jgi:alkanesulfonate monooxygenase SsuD/methylene tetrahydromethanopterin reductase-like flavin-dependent oxidoreductase (luciferase family)|nr:LLM class flavin-dependent oxidoreductase [Burkholderiales bacterium]